MTTVINLLDRPLYSASEAARLLRVRNGQAVMRWVDGYSRAGVDYPPVIRERSTGDDVLTWGEFVEARYIAALRANGASLQRLRKVISLLKDEFGTAYPLAYTKPFMDGRDVVLKAESDLELPKPLRLVRVVEGQLRLSTPADNHVHSVIWDEDFAKGLRVAGPSSPVVIDPVRGFGMPSLEGRNLRTEVLAELYLAGDSVDSIAEGYDLTRDQVDAALRWELSALQAS